MMLVSREFSFTASHRIPDYYGHPEKLHSHNYKIRVTVEGEVQENGLVLDFCILKWIFEKHILSKFDGKYLNDVLPVPSVEHMAKFVWKILEPFREHVRKALEDLSFQKKAMEHTGAATFTPQENSTVRLYEIAAYEGDDKWVIYRKTA